MDIFDTESIPDKKTVNRKPSKASKLKNLEREILDQALLIKQSKVKYQQLLEEYNELKNSQQH